ncbi:hypothetical protein G3O08_07405 [Cryomorpha ignava]|uniref:Uncharacterized protein n=1 Tax=Cryomorpha ignava TaxID=101383 RepID=A0A7K3WNT8_9FLAO|nr:hypothetical protein [Cryomorpha ignava]NEN23323.1 hypothetical protein [Cryomorpha ignava]
MRLFLFLILFTPFGLLAQKPAELLFMNGKRLEVYDLNDTSYVPLQYKYDKNFFKKERMNIKAARKQGVLFNPNFSTPKAEAIPIVLKNGGIDREDVFSVTYPSGDEKVYYFFDEPMGNYLREDQMRAFVYGERDARNAVTGKGWFYGGLATGAITGYALKTSVVSLAVPPLFALTAKIPTIHIKERYIADKAYQYNEDYASGFESFARSKNTIEALKGSAIGTVLGIIAYSIIDNNR